MPKRRRSKVMRGTTVDEITEDQYRLALRMIRDGQSEIEIRTACRFTNPQWHALKHQGVDSKGWPPLAETIAQEAAEAIQKGKDAARSLGSEGAERLLAASKICNNAQLIANMVLTALSDKLTRNAQLKRPKSLDSMLPSPKVTALLKALAPYADVGKLADAFHRMYGERAGVAARPRVAEQPPAAVSIMEERMGDASTDEAGTALMQDVLSWTPAQIDHFLATDEEPDQVPTTH